MKIWNKLSLPKRGPVQSYATVFQRQIEADRLYHGIPTDVEGFRAKFKRNLIGYWKAESDESSTTEWMFLADGTAWQRTHSFIIGDTESHFRWRERADFLIEMCQASDDDEDSNWFPIHYNFKAKDGQIVLLQLPASPTFKFYLTTDYPIFQGDHE